MTVLLNPETLAVIHIHGGQHMGIILREGKCIFAPADVSRLHGKTVEEIEKICLKEGWTIKAPIDWIVDRVKEG